MSSRSEQSAPCQAIGAAAFTPAGWLDGLEGGARLSRVDFLGFDWNGAG